jgi:hypothetical protein
MLFPRNALASGPQACFLAEKRLAKVKVGKFGKGIDKNTILWLAYFGYYKIP